MKLRKDKWLELEFPEAIDFQEGPGILAKDFQTNGVPLIRLAGMDDGVSLLNGCNYLDEELVARKYEHFKLKKGDIILSTSATLGKTSYVDDEAVGAIVYTGLVRMRPKNSEVYAPFIKYLLQSPRFTQQIESMGVGSVMKHFGPTHLKKISITLPTFDEQKTISELFPALEAAMEQVDGQVQHLKALRKSLINKLTKQKPEFGNLLTKSNCKEYSIGDIAVEVPDRTDNPQKSGIEKFIGLEDFESGELTIQKFSSTEKLVSAMKLCKQGDVLFARRNAYLKRASLTDFDAVCSGDVIVMRAKEKIILPKFLILIMNTDEFWEFAISNAAGTMSKRVKWRDLATYTFELPELRIQEEILKVFNQLENTISQLKQQKATLRLLKQKLLNEILV
jgi:type I restriction enzyme S subunit